MAGFQSPSLRGSGRFGRRAPICGAPRRVSIPFIAGQWSLRLPGAGAGRQRRVSIPFIAGQWSLARPAFRLGPRFRVFQSPSLRGSGRWVSANKATTNKAKVFQSPSLRGSGRGRRQSNGRSVRRKCFNPLHCGAVVAQFGVVLHEIAESLFQSPSLRGSGRSGTSPGYGELLRRLFQSPSLRGSGRSPRTTPSSLFGVLLRKRRLPCDHIICTRLPF